MSEAAWFVLAVLAAALSAACCTEPFPLARLRLAPQRRRWSRSARAAGRGAPARSAAELVAEIGRANSPRPGGPALSTPLLVCLALVVVLVGAMGVAAGLLIGAALVAFIAPVALSAAVLRRRVIARDRREQRLREAVLVLCDAVVAELRAGRAPEAALAAAAATSPELSGPLARTLAAACHGGNVPAAMLAAASTPGLLELRRVAACWRVAADAGAGLAEAVERVGDGMRAESAVRREVLAQLASPRASARVLAALPGLALLLGAGVGARPLDILLQTRLGAGCLLAGLALNALGIFWTDALARRAADAR